MLLGVAAAYSLQAATLSAPSQNANPGDTVSLSIMYSSAGQVVSGVQFDLTWDPTLDIHVAPGAQVGLAGKVLYAAVLHPRGLRCLIVGMNTTLSDGELVRLFITVSNGAAPGVGQFSLVNSSAASPDGASVLLQGGSINVQIQNGSATQLIQPSGVLNAASLAAGPVSPGEIITLFGSISAASPVILFNDVPAPIIYSGLNQVNAIVPFGLDLSNPAKVEVRQGLLTAKTSVPVAAASPAIFTLGATGTGMGAILNQDYSVNGPSNAAARGSVLMVFGTGFGVLNPLPADGQIEQILATIPSPVTATIGGIPAPVIYVGAAPGLIAGVVQINVRVPDGLSANSAAPISLSMGSFTTAPGVTISIQ